MTVSLPTSCIDTRLRAARGWRGLASITSSSWPSDTVCSARSAGENVNTPKSMVRSSSAAATWRDAMRRTSINTWGGRPEAGDDRQQRMDGGFVGADDDAAAAHLLQLADGESPASEARVSRRPA